MKKNRIVGVAMVFLACMFISSCGEKQTKDESEVMEVIGENENQEENEDTNEKVEEKIDLELNTTEDSLEEKDWSKVYTVSEYTPNPDRLKNLNLSSDLDKYDLEADTDQGVYDREFAVTLEAENAIMEGNVVAEDDVNGYTGTGYINGIQGQGDTVTFQVTVPGSGNYDLNFVSCGYYGDKQNVVSLDGVNIGNTQVSEGKEFVDCIMTGVYMETGEHEIEVSCSWGWVLIDKLIVTAQKEQSSKKEMTAELINPYATKRAKQLMQFLVDINGDYILSGQYADAGQSSAEFDVIRTSTGREPAILGLDLIEYSPSRASHGSKSQAYVRAKAFDEAGGIITMCWHWNAPEQYLYNTDEHPWWSGFYTEGSSINLAKIMNGYDQEGYDALMKDIDVIAFQLERLQELDIPILWRPLHEASGGWFWWGASGAEAYKELWKVLYEKLTYEHGLHNLIWVWNGQAADWYPGDDYVDIIGEDIYPGNRVYSSQASKYNEASAYTTANKIVTLSENGCLFDPNLAFRDGAVWSWFCTWNGEFVLKNSALSEDYTESTMFDQVYNHKKVITLDELPDLKTYGD